jgi:hemopexin
MHSRDLFEEFDDRPRPGGRVRGASSGIEAREADLFFQELTGRAPRRRRNWPGAAEAIGEAAPGPIDAVVKWPNGKAYFFYGADYVRYDVKADKVDSGYPRPIAGNWTGLFTSGIDAAIEWGNGKVYFFKGDQYSRYDIVHDRVDTGFPKPIAGNWPGLFTDGIDAAVNWGNGKAYFFKGDQYIRYDIKTDKADPGFPKSIAGNWPGLFTADIDDAVNWGNGKVYFFKGDEYIRYDIKADRADAGYPLGIAAKWPGLHPTSTCTCTHTRRNYANGTVSTADLIGTKATIKTRYGKVCCEGTTATSSAYKVAWTGVTKPEGTMTWAQTGYGRERNSGSATIKNYRYWEINGSSYNVFYDVAHPPADNSTHTYQCEVDNSAGKWKFEFDGTEWATFTDAGWRSKTGTRADYTGEIFNDTDDMPGTAANKCTYRDCKKKSSGGSYVDAGLTTSNVKSTDSSQWGANRVSASGMDIWDKNPLP